MLFNKGLGYSTISPVKAAEDNSILYEYKPVNLTLVTPTKTLHYQINRATLLQQGDEGVLTAGNSFYKTPIKFTVRLGDFTDTKTIPQQNNQLPISIISKQQFEQNCGQNICDLYIDLEAQTQDLTEESLSMKEYSTQVQLRFRTQNRWSNQKIGRHVQSQLVQKKDNVEQLQVFRYQYFNSKANDQAVTAVSTNDFSDKNFKVMIKVLTEYDKPPMSLSEFNEELAKQPFLYSDTKVQLKCSEGGCINVFDIYFYYSSESSKDQTWFFISTSQAYTSIPTYTNIGVNSQGDYRYRPSQQYSIFSLVNDGVKNNDNQNLKLDFEYYLDQDSKSEKSIGDLSTIYLFYKDDDNELRPLHAYSDLRTKDLNLQNPVPKYSYLLLSDPAYRIVCKTSKKIQLKNTQKDYLIQGNNDKSLFAGYERQYLLDVKNLTNQNFQMRLNQKQQGLYLSYLPYRKSQNNMIFPTINLNNNIESNIPNGYQTDLGTNIVIDFNIDNANIDLLLITMLNTNQQTNSFNLKLCDGICEPIKSGSSDLWWIILLIIGGIAVVGGIVFFIIKKKKKASQKSDNNYQNMQHITDNAV